MGGPDHQQIVLGGRLLPATASKGQLVSGRREGVGVQVDTDPLPLLADRNTVRREHLPQRPEEAWFVTPQEPRTSGVTRSGRRLRMRIPDRRVAPRLRGCCELSTAGRRVACYDH